MNCRVLFTDTAKRDLREIALYLADLTQDRNTAIRFVRKLQEHTRILEQLPESGGIPRDRVLKSSGYRFLVYKDYLMFYQYHKEESTAYIMAVFHGKRDYVRVMRKYF